MLLQALHLSFHTLRTFLADDAVNTAVAVAGLLVALDQRRSRRPADQATSNAEAPPETDPAAEAAATAEPVPPDVVEHAAASLGELAGRLRESMAIADRAEAMARDVLQELAADPAGAAQFLALLRGRQQ